MIINSLEILASPFYQVFVLCALLFLTAIVFGFNTMNILLYGFYYCVGWLAISLFYGVFTENMWYYILYTAISLLIYYAIWFGIAYVSTKVGEPYDGDGWMVFLMPVNTFIIILAFALPIRGLFYLYQRMF